VKRSIEGYKNRIEQINILKVRDIYNFGTCLFSDTRYRAGLNGGGEALIFVQFSAATTESNINFWVWEIRIKKLLNKFFISFIYCVIIVFLQHHHHCIRFFVCIKTLLGIFIVLGIVIGYCCVVNGFRVWWIFVSIWYWYL